MQAITIPITIFFIIIYLFQIWKRNPKILFIGSVFFIEMIWQIVSIVWLDGGAYISEELRYSYFTGASIRFVILLLPFAILYPYFLNKELNKRKYINLEDQRIRGKHLSENDIYIIILLIVMYSLLDILISGKVPLFSRINYSAFYSSYSKLPLTSTIHNYLLPFFAVLLGVFTGRNRQNKKKYRFLVLFVLIICIQLLLNNKFYGLYDYVLHFLMGYSIFLLFSRRKNKLPIKYIILALCGFGILLYICYSKYSKSMLNPIQYLLDRIFSLQNHTFWGIDRLWQIGEMSTDWNGFIGELLSGFSEFEVSRLDSNFGIARVMYFVTASTYARDMLSTGYLFAGSYLTIILSYVGYIPAFISSFIMAYVISKLSVSLYKNILQQKYIMLFFVFFVFRRFFEYFRVGNIAMILNWKFLIIYCFLFAYYVLLNYRKHERKRL
ncbi:MAG: DUF6418 domain-containing protein [Floccifex sp.]